MKKMNNKGFSLVELIVVVLIMAIIAVALAPQVMKWVENSRKSTDAQNYDSIVSAANIALSNELVYKAVAGAGANIVISATTTNGNYSFGGTDVTPSLGTQMGTTLGTSWLTDIKVKASVLDSIKPNGDPSTGYEITVEKGTCSVLKSKAPYNPNS